MQSFSQFIKGVNPDYLSLVIGINNTTGLSIIRDLGIHNVAVIGLDENSIAIGRFSKYCKHFIKYSDESHLLKTLINVGKKLKNKIPIFVSSDNLVIFIEKKKHILSDYFLFYWQGKKSLLDLIDKRKMLKFAEHAGLDIPQTFFSSDNTVATIEKQMKYPSVVKPPFTKGKKLVVVNSREEFLNVITDQLFENGFIVQELIPGLETNIFLSGTYSNNKGELIVCACGKKERQLPKNFGFATKAVAIKSDAINKLSEKFIKYLKYNGPADIEFKKSDTNGKYIFVEINPRFPGFNQLFTSSGFTIAYATFLDLKKQLNNNIITNPEHREVRYMSIFFDFITVFRSYNDVSLYRWLKELVQCNSFAVFSLRDPGPFCAQFINLLSRAITWHCP